MKNAEKKSKEKVVEIDQSGKVEKLNTSTTVAFSNGTSGAVFISAGAKRIVIQKLRRSSLPSNVIYPLVFATLVFIATKNCGASILAIDEEYTGKEKLISETIEKLRFKFGLKNFVLRFVRIGKLSDAHRLAWSGHRFKGRKTSVERVTDQEIMKLLANIASEKSS